MTRELQPTWTSFVAALEAELGRKNRENHQLRQALEILRKRELSAWQQLNHRAADEVDLQRA
jgi:hypothetical protein